MKRTVALGAAWTASAAAAVGLGFLAVSFVDASASPGTQPVAASTTSSTPSSSSAAPSSAASPSSDPSPTTAPQMSPGEYVTAGGTVYAHCTSGSPVVAGVPAAGFWVDDSNDSGKIEFESNRQEVEVRVSCDGDVPVFRLDDGSGHGGSGHGGSDDDNSGRGGSDDSDDSSGHGGSDDD